MELSDSTRPEDVKSSKVKPNDPPEEPSPQNDETSSASNSPPEDATPKAPSPTPSNHDMDLLTESLDSTLKIRDMATKVSRFVPVPHGFRLTLEAGPSEFYRVKEEHKRKNKRKREAGLISKSSTQYRRLGYRPEEVLWNGALSLKDCRPSNLTNEIHPLLQHSRFDDTPDAIYRELETGLRLATMFLTQPICCQFWVTLASGERKIEEKYTKIHGTKCERIEKNVPMTKENTAIVIEYIKQLDNASIIHWNFKPNLMLNNETMYGVTNCVFDNQYELTKGPFNTIVRHHIKLHADFYTVAAKLSKLEHPDTAQKLRFSFFLATVICHELAHAIEGAHHRGRHKGRDRYFEPWLFEDEVAEMGRAWESVTLGGVIHPINSAVNCSHGIGTWDWPDIDSQGFLETGLKYTISMKYIEKLFQTKTWQREFDLKEWKTFHIPRDGAISLNFNTFTTMPWSEELRVAKEELEESLAIADPDQPAAKKREIATGQAVNASAKCRGEMPPAKDPKPKDDDDDDNDEAQSPIPKVTPTPLIKSLPNLKPLPPIPTPQKHLEMAKSRKTQRRNASKSKTSMAPSGMALSTGNNTIPATIKARRKAKKSAADTNKPREEAGEATLPIASVETELSPAKTANVPSKRDIQPSPSAEKQSPSTEKQPPFEIQQSQSEKHPNYSSPPSTSAKLSPAPSSPPTQLPSALATPGDSPESGAESVPEGESTSEGESVAGAIPAEGPP